MNKLLWCLAACAAVAMFTLPALVIEAQRGPGGKGPGGKGPGGNKNQPWGKGAGKTKLPSLQIEDVKPDGVYEVFNLLPTQNEQPRIAATEDKAYRLINYVPETRSLRFATLDVATGALGVQQVKVPDGVMLPDAPRMAYDGGQHVVITHQAATLFVDVAKKNAKLAAGVDPAVATTTAAPPGRGGRNRGGDSGALPAEAYRVHGGGGGKHALSVLVKWDNGSKRYTGSGATLHFADERSVTLDWNHDVYGVPPKDRDAVCAVTDSEIVVLVTKPRSGGNFKAATDIACLVFDRKGVFKTAQRPDEPFAGGNAARFTLSPCGDFLAAHAEGDGLHSHVMKRGTWERVFKIDYMDGCIGFAPEGKIGVFIENRTPQRVAIKAIELATGKALWETSMTHKEVDGTGDDEPFTSISAGAKVVALQSGIMSGVSSDEPTWIYRANAIDFEPLCMSYDEAGKLVAVMARNRVFVLDARTRNEVHSIDFPTPLPEGALGEFVAFDSRSRKVMACARNQGVWLMDLATNTIEKSLPAVPGIWPRAMPDLSGVVYSLPKDKGGNVMLQRFETTEPERIYRCEYKDAIAVCYWIDPKGKEFLVAEREVGEGRLFMVNDKGGVVVTYNITDADPAYTGDATITAFVGKGRKVFLINEFNRWEYTGINCTVIGAGADESIETSFSAVFKTSDLPGRSTYGATAASPFFGGLHAGDERVCKFACPAGVLEVDVGKGIFTLHAWSRKPIGLAAINPKGKEFFVAGSTGLTTYKIK